MATPSDDKTLERVFAEAFRRRRQFLGLSQADVAARADELGLTGCVQQTIAKVESAKRPKSLRLDEADLLARAVDSTLEELIRPPLNVPVAQVRRQRRSAERRVRELEEEHVEAEAAAKDATERLREVKGDLLRQRRLLGDLDALLSKEGE